MAIWVGTSGYNYPEWKGSFYPETLPAAKMLPYYAERFPTVEINYTFYRTPNEKILDGLEHGDARALQADAEGAEADHARRRLRDCGDRVRQFLETASTLGPKLGALLFQLPPNLKKDLALFDAFLDDVPAARLRGVRVPPHLVARRGGLRALARAEPGAVRRRQREAVDAGRDHGRLRLLPAARRGLHGRRHRALGATSFASRRQRCQRRLRVLQARRGREGAGVRADADGTAACARNEPDDLALPPSSRRTRRARARRTRSGRRAA